MAPSTSPDSAFELVCVMDNKNNNCDVDDDDGNYMKKSTANSEQRQQQEEDGGRRGARRTTTAFCLHDELMTHFCTFVKIFAIHHFKQRATSKRARGAGRRSGRGYQLEYYALPDESQWSQRLVIREGERVIN